MDSPLLHARDISCSLHSSETTPLRIESLSFECAPSSLNLLLGSEACGTRQLLRILGLLEKPDTGEVFLHNFPTSHLSATELASLRSHRFGYLFPEPFLLPSLSVFENVAVPLFKISEVDVETARQRTVEALGFVGLAAQHKPIVGELPLFEQHRVALARALVNQPELLIIENLGLPEPELAGMLELVRKAVIQTGVAAIFSSSQDWLASHMDYVLEMGRSTHPTQAEP